MRPHDRQREGHSPQIGGIFPWCEGLLLVRLEPRQTTGRDEELQDGRNPVRHALTWTHERQVTPRRCAGAARRHTRFARSEPGRGQTQEETQEERWWLA